MRIMLATQYLAFSGTDTITHSGGVNLHQLASCLTNANHSCNQSSAIIYN